MRVRVLGSAAGGGFPQWNCGCENCRLARAGDERVEARTQDSLAFEVDGRVLVVNASPDVLRQIERTPSLHPSTRRGTPIAAIVLTNGDLDHVLGLFSLRESQPLVVYATDRVFRGLVEHNAMMKTLARFEGHLTHRRLVIDERCDVAEVPGLAITPFASPGKLPVHLARTLVDTHAEDNIGLRVSFGEKTVTVATAVRDVASITNGLAESDVVFLDGTFWTSDELVKDGLGTARAEDMAHQPLGGDGGSLAALATAKLGRKILTHINNTNPILRKDSPERARAVELGWEIASDGMEITP